MRSESNGRRLNSLVGSIITIAILLMCLLAGLSFLVTQTHKFHTAYSMRMREYTNNEWLVNQCKSPEFYSNMKQHSSLCEDVQKNQSDALWLHALRDVLEQCSLCGTHTCEVLLQSVFGWVAAHSFHMAVSCCICVFLVAYVLIPCQRRLFSPYNVLQADSQLALHTHLRYPRFENLDYDRVHKRTWNSAVRGQISNAVYLE